MVSARGTVASFAWKERSGRRAKSQRAEEQPKQRASDDAPPLQLPLYAHYISRRRGTASPALALTSLDQHHHSHTTFTIDSPFAASTHRNACT
mmetsp:Transcript_29426/g.77343  ORF Transcript_29426/g.77343 Transcript_29426/m.77343 type:complete len:93 (+) Transcript_29426:892-1170(+)